MIHDKKLVYINKSKSGILATSLAILLILCIVLPFFSLIKGSLPERSIDNKNISALCELAGDANGAGFSNHCGTDSQDFRSGEHALKDSVDKTQIFSIGMQPAREANARAADNTLETISAYGNTERITIRQIDYSGNEINITVERKKNGDNYTYFLADALRNINVLNNTKDDQGKPLYAGRLISETIGVGYDDNNIFSDRVAVSLFANLVKAWDFYANPNSFGMSIFGIDPASPQNDIRCDAAQNSETEIVALVHYDTEWENAAYFSSKNKRLKETFAFGDGKANTLFDLGTALDVVGHEYQHAVTRAINPLEYSGESGALNEAYSDIFGMLIQDYELNDVRFWRMGEDIASELMKNCIRDIQNPQRKNLPDHMDNRYIDPDGQNNNKTVHLNSCIITHALYNMYEKAVDISFEAFTKHLIGKLYYTALPQLSTTASFSEFRTFLTDAAHKIGLNDGDSAILKDIIDYGFDRVGVAFEDIENLDALIMVTYFDVENNILRKDRVLKIENSSPPNIVTLYTKGWFDYSFSEWKKEVLPNGDVEYKARYKKTLSRESVIILLSLSTATFVCTALLLGWMCKRISNNLS